MRLGKREKCKLIALIQAGFSIQEIAEQTGCSHQQIRYHAKQKSLTLITGGFHEPVLKLVVEDDKGLELEYRARLSTRSDPVKIRRATLTIDNVELFSCDDSP